ncbi:hypothetical protein GCM10010472_70990 [Pseudonocardia halophobica]|uniref:Carboxymuconolactone decarboxylase-like domain-containing protein n=1 Tax=Pseudonocardia halophobica TaxID=29401 RepID=A0A9W6L4S9_9PSEU|nr:carboxymuconolactone decarboxylase family protein [Pseudonocardia halophobica]GLL12244.1 hypothetical protein GCM10017577_33850 [Pseudonocardia halophobica]
MQQVGAALRFDPDLPPRLRELAILTVAAHTRSEFEWTAHESAARDTGLTTEHLQALLDGAIPTGLAVEEVTAIELTKALLDDHQVEDDLYRRAAASFDAAGLAALTWLVGYYAMLAGALAVFRLQTERGADDIRGQRWQRDHESRPGAAGRLQPSFSSPLTTDHSDEQSSPLMIEKDAEACLTSRNEFR